MLAVSILLLYQTNVNCIFIGSLWEFTTISKPPMINLLIDRFITIIAHDYVINRVPVVTTSDAVYYTASVSDCYAPNDRLVESRDDETGKNSDDF